MWGSNKFLSTFLNLWARKLFLVFAQKLEEKKKSSPRIFQGNRVLVSLQEKPWKIIEFFVCMGSNNLFLFLGLSLTKLFLVLIKKFDSEIMRVFFSERLLYNKEQAKKLWTQIISLKKKKVFTSFCFFLSLIKMLFFAYFLTQKPPKPSQEPCFDNTAEIKLVKYIYPKIAPAESKPSAVPLNEQACTFFS